MRNFISYLKLHSLRRLYKVLVPYHTAIESACIHRGASQPQEYIKFLTPDGSEGSACQFREQNDSDPRRRACTTLTSNQAQVNRTRHHQETDKQGSQDGLGGETFPKLRGFKLLRALFPVFFRPSFGAISVADDM